MPLFHYSSEERIEAAEIFDQLDQLVLKIDNLMSNSIDLSGEPEGIYYIRLRNSDHLILIKKVLITQDLKP